MTVHVTLGYSLTLLILLAVALAGAVGYLIGLKVCSRAMEKIKSLEKTAPKPLSKL